MGIHSSSIYRNTHTISLSLSLSPSPPVSTESWERSLISVNTGLSLCLPVDDSLYPSVASENSWARVPETIIENTKVKLGYLAKITLFIPYHENTRIWVVPITLIIRALGFSPDFWTWPSSLYLQCPCRAHRPDLQPFSSFQGALCSLVRFKC